MKQSFYFQHDYNAANDIKILYLRQQLGIEGYGIFWYIIEQLAQAGGILPFKVIPVISMQIQTTPDKVASVIKNYELFEFEDDQFFSIRLSKQINFRKQLSEDGKRGAKLRWNKDTHLKQIDSPPINPPNAKERKEKESNTDEYLLEQVDFTLYEKNFKPEDPIYKKTYLVHKYYNFSLKEFGNTAMVENAKDWFCAAEKLLKVTDYDTVSFVLKWAIEDEFWRKHVITLPTFLKHFAKLNEGYKQSKK